MKLHDTFLAILLIFVASSQTHARNEKLYKQVRSQLKGRGDYIVKKIERKGERTIQLQAYLSADLDINLAPKLLESFVTYRNWLLDGINKRPEGGEYYVRIEDFTAPPGNPTFVNILFNLDLPLYKLKGIQRFRARTIAEKDQITMTAFATKSEKSVIESSDIRLTIFPAEEPNRAWLHLNAVVKMRAWLLYAALPERLLKNEVGARFKIIIDNYRKAEDRLYRELASPKK